MKLLHEPPAGFVGINRAFAMAKHLPTTHRLSLKIGIAQDGVLLAVGELDGYRQVTFFTDHLKDLGYREHLLGSDDDMMGCDMLFSAPPRPAATDQESDPSFIRKPTVELWPVRN